MECRRRPSFLDSLLFPFSSPYLIYVLKHICIPTEYAVFGDRILICINDMVLQILPVSYFLKQHIFLAFPMLIFVELIFYVFLILGILLFAWTIFLLVLSLNNEHMDYFKIPPFHTAEKMGNFLLQFYGSKIHLSLAVFPYTDVINTHGALSALSRHQSHHCHQSAYLLTLEVLQIRGEKCTQTQEAMTAKVEMVKVEK